jgi:hypothetical protein
LYAAGYRDSGVYFVQSSGANFWFLQVFCDMDTDHGGWTVD